MLCYISEEKTQSHQLPGREDKLLLVNPSTPQGAALRRDPGVTSSCCARRLKAVVADFVSVK